MTGKTFVNDRVKRKGASSALKSISQKIAYNSR